MSDETRQNRPLGSVDPLTEVAPSLAPACLGIVRIGDAEIGIHAEELQEVVSVRLPLAALPGTPDHVLGAVALRGTPLPVLDLARLLRPGSAPSPERPLLLILAAGSSRIGIPADAIVRISRPPQSAFQSVTSSDALQRRIFPQVFVEGTKVISVMDALALAMQPGVLSIKSLSSDTSLRPGSINTNPSFSPSANSMAPQEAAGFTRTLFRCGAITLAVDVSGVSSVSTVGEVQTTGLPSQLLLGILSLRGRQTALIDLARLLQLPSADENQQPTSMMVIQSEKRSVAFGISAVVGIEYHPADRLQPLAGCGIRRQELYLGSILSPKFGEIIVLNHTAIVAHPDIRDLTSIRDDSADQRLAAGIADSAARSNFIVYHAGQSTFATPVAQVEAVLPLPEGWLPLRQSQDALAGLGKWKDRILPLVDLGSLLGHPIAEAELHQSRVLVVRDGTGYRGYLVKRVESLQAAVPQPMPWGVDTPREITRNGFKLPVCTRMIGVESSGRRRNATLLDLPSLSATHGASAQA